MKNAMTIAGLAKAVGVGVETVRYYQRRGLLNVPTATGAVRHYSPDDLRRLRFIRRAQGAGFTLEEITELLALDTKIQELEASRTALERLRATCASGRGGACPIIEAFDPG